jgi:hypothetical protein
MHMENTVGKLSEKTDRVNHLPMEMARVEVETETLAIVYRLKRSLCSDNIEGNLSRMDLKGELHLQSSRPLPAERCTDSAR